MENRATGAGGPHHRAIGRWPKLVFWSAYKTVCPEPYIDASVEPGRSDVVAAHLHVLRGEAQRRDAALTRLFTRAIGYRTTVARPGQF